MRLYLYLYLSVYTFLEYFTHINFDLAMNIQRMKNFANIFVDVAING